ncbi:recombinase family protein [Oenococcus oeni]|uniref:Site-specific recombinase, DNA invertase Pin related protein n=16 Tax=Oenococcus oeni TaxID=1247 RepID=Q04FZ9_OENOB|nr:recombinase family protein [Oenococcus oeni]ABJ56623.1 Site-specific recombinase, DNA invertase Pin related protein [Oenococcus oeni PSU-1]AWW98218.1 recombinase family protein [Oenococcus oeni]EJO01972.1 site-specific recombinase, DNA invertase Pin related protein [Oenococcus oeni AWRIB419]EJO05388.1 site-specific recombinase, DNA invertase Pin related protein [Oenococcus oeni AWRIB553]EKP88620.1 site-specific recombinase, DNA invertase Pin related protein [Oenococcus oeni DSM 20252 = AWRI
MKIAYARVSSQEQNLARQIARLKAIPVDRIFAKKQSGKNFSERNKLKNLLFSLKKGDIVYVTSLDRLGRNANDLTKLIQLIREKGATFQSLDLPDFSAIPDPNLRNMLNDILLTVFKFQAQSERERIHERQRQGIEIAKTKGIYKGRPVLYSALTNNIHRRSIYLAIKKDLKKGESAIRLAKKYGVSHSTVYRIKHELHL